MSKSNIMYLAIITRTVIFLITIAIFMIVTEYYGIEGLVASWVINFFILWNMEKAVNYVILKWGRPR